jgi:hypothetical protein
MLVASLIGLTLAAATGGVLWIFGRKINARQFEGLHFIFVMCIIGPVVSLFYAALVAGVAVGLYDWVATQLGWPALLFPWWAPRHPDGDGEVILSWNAIYGFAVVYLIGMAAWIGGSWFRDSK